MQEEGNNPIALVKPPASPPGCTSSSTTAPQPIEGPPFFVGQHKTGGRAVARGWERRGLNNDRSCRCDHRSSRGVVVVAERV
jgi:hypothetical protein